MGSVSLMDVALGIPIILWFAKGLQNGFVKEALGLLGLIIAVILAFSLQEDTHALLVEWIGKDPIYMPLVAMGIIFIAVILATQLLIFSFNKALEMASINGINRIAGALFGAAKAGIVLSLLLLLLAGFDKPNAESRSTSILYPYVLPFAVQTYDVLTKAFPGVHNFRDTMQNTLKENNPLERILDNPSNEASENSN